MPLARSIAAFAFLCTSAVQAQPLPDCGFQAAGLLSTRWRTTQIAVCWEPGSENFTAERNLVRTAIGDTWERNSALHFTGWGNCAPNAPGIHIQVQDAAEAPHTEGLGSQIDGRRGGMSLNFTFQRWSVECAQKRDFCIRAIAVHEFGHAIGFTHEQNRPDAPSWCREEAQGSEPDALITQYDPQSIMNYCNSTWNNAGLLSQKDIIGVQAWYGKPANPLSRYDGRWVAHLNYSDQSCQSDELQITLSGGRISGTATTPQGLRITVNGQVDSASDLRGVVFNFSPVDRVEISGAFPHALVRSSDCGCGSTQFVRPDGN